VVCSFLILGLRFHPKGQDIECHDRRWPALLRQHEAACFQLPSSRTALNLMKGQIQFQNFVAVWLSRRRDSRRIFWPC